MDDRELEARLRLVAKALKAYGITDPDRIEAVVDCTLGVPWVVPPVRGEEPGPPRLLFPEAVAGASLVSEFGAPDPADIMKEAVKIGGRVRSEIGSMTPLRWVADARRGLMGAEAEQLLEIGAGDFGDLVALEPGRRSLASGDPADD